MSRLRLRQQDEAELRRVFREHVDSVFAFFAYNVPREAAEDLTSATFEKVLRNWRKYDAGKASERTWILAIARNGLIDHFRRESHRTALSVDEHPGLLEVGPVADDFVAHRLDADELREWMGILGDREREVLALRYGADLPASEIATLLGLSVDNVHQIHSRSLRRLRQHAHAATE